MNFLTPSQASRYLPTAYNKFSAEFSSTRHYQWKEFQDLSKTTQSGSKILDLGCGNGRLSHFLDEHWEGITYTGVDISKNLLKEARRLYPEKKFYEGSFLNLPEEVSDQKFHQVWIIASFHHLATHADRKKALQNIWDILENDGECICTVWNLWEQKKYNTQKQTASFTSFWNPLWGKRDFIIPWGQQKTPRYYYAFDQHELSELFQECGFKVQEIFLSEGEKNICIRVKKSMDAKKFFVQQIPFTKTTFTQALQTVQSWNNQNDQHSVYTPNPEMIVESKGNKEFQMVLQNASISLADGNGILWASGLDNLKNKAIHWRWSIGIFKLFQYFLFPSSYPKKIKNVICGSDIFREYLESSEQKKHIFLLGGVPGSAEYITKKYPEKISGYFDGMVNPKTTPQIIEQIKNSGASILFVALGAPKQELWIQENLDHIHTIKVALGVGGSFDFISGHQTRAPKFFRTLKLEWLYRLWKEPARAHRIWNATGKFIALCLKTPLK